MLAFIKHYIDVEFPWSFKQTVVLFQISGLGEGFGCKRLLSLRCLIQLLVRRWLQQFGSRPLTEIWQLIKQILNDWNSNFLLQYYKTVLFILDLSFWIVSQYSTMDSISFHPSFLHFKNCLLLWLLRRYSGFGAWHGGHQDTHGLWGLIPRWIHHQKFVWGSLVLVIGWS